MAVYRRDREANFGGGLECIWGADGGAMCSAITKILQNDDKATAAWSACGVSLDNRDAEHNLNWPPAAGAQKLRQCRRVAGGSRKDRL